MKPPINLLGSATVSAAADITTVGFGLNDLTTCCVQVVFSGGAGDLAGTLYLQGSLDNVTWFSIPGESQAVTSSANHIWDVQRTGLIWLRVFWDYTSGTGNVAIALAPKESI